MQPARRPGGLPLQPLLPADTPRDRWLDLPRPLRIRLPAALGRALSTARTDEAAHPGGRIYRSHLDQLHLRHRRPLPRHQRLTPDLSTPRSIALDEGNSANYLYGAGP